MPQVGGDPGDDPSKPRGRIRNTLKLLLVSALILSIYLLASVLVTTVLIPAKAFLTHGEAAHRALSYLAHGGLMTDGFTAERLNPLLGPGFGSLYDFATVVILCMAGMNVVVALQTLVPQFLLRFGMELRWIDRTGVLITVFALVNLAVTLWFQASVDAQRGAYAASVLALISNASIV